VQIGDNGISSDVHQCGTQLNNTFEFLNIIKILFEKSCWIMVRIRSYSRCTAEDSLSENHEIRDFSSFFFISYFVFRIFFDGGRRPFNQQCNHLMKVRAEFFKRVRPLAVRAESDSEEDAEEVENNNNDENNEENDVENNVIL
jgi:hypothetical protein